MKDNFSLVAAAAGGFMLSVALSGILRGTPVVSWQAHSFASPLETRLIASFQNSHYQEK